LINQRIAEMIRLKIIIDVIGMYNLKLGLFITISPGNLPKGSLEIQGQKIPAIKKAIPATINIF
jgi:hypothetical protein